MVLACICSGLALWSPQAAATQAITSAGPLTNIEITDTLNCAVNHAGDTEGEFFGDTACGTFVAVGENIFGPADIPAGNNVTGAPGYVAFTPVSQTPVTGAGSGADPFRIVTVVDLGGTGLRLTQTDTYVVGQESYRTDVMLTNNGGGPQAVVVYRAGDCFLQDSDDGFGAVDAATGSVSCVGVMVVDGNEVPSSRIEQWRPLTPGSSYYEAEFDEVWAAIATRAPFNNTCRCDELIDNGAGLSWSATIPAGGSQTFSHLTSFSPTGNQPLGATKTADAATVAPGGSDGYTITISNPNTSAVTLTSITDTLPAGFTYTPGTTTGVTTTDPSTAGQTLTWTGPFSVPPSGTVTLHFNVTASTTPGTYFNNAGAEAESFAVAPTGDTAPVTVGSGGTTTTTLPSNTTTTTGTPGSTTSTTSGATTSTTSGGGDQGSTTTAVVAGTPQTPPGGTLARTGSGPRALLWLALLGVVAGALLLSLGGSARRHRVAWRGGRRPRPIP